jgi:hypothetical protein
LPLRPVLTQHLPGRFCKEFLVLAAVALFVVLSSAVRAQGLGSVSGSITDTTGAAIPGASVTIKQTEKNLPTAIRADASGVYSFPALPPAAYGLKVVAPGFQTYTQSGITLQADQSLTINVKLEIGSADTTVSVTAEAPQVNTTNGTLNQVVDERRINDLPLNGRNVAQLTTLVAGSVTAPNDAADQGQTKTFPVAVTISTNGSRANQVNYLLDGGNNLDEYTNVNMPFPMPDSTQEFSVQTSNYSAQYGQNAGGVVNIISKSGTNKFHGDAFEYVRNGIFNAANRFSSYGVDPLKRNQFGGTLGGPFTIPHLYHGRDKTFFFLGYQHESYRDTIGSSQAYLPTPANINGDFSALLSASNPANPRQKVIQIVNPLTKVAYAGDKIDPRTYDPAAVSLLQFLPIASEGANGLVFYQKPTSQNFDEGLARVDQNIGTKDRLFVRYFADNFLNSGFLNPSNLLTYSDNVNIFSSSAIVGETHTFTPNVLNEFRLSYAHEIAQRGPVPGAPSANTLGVNIYLPPSAGIQSISTSSGFTIGDNPLAQFIRNNYTLADDVHWVKGNHSFGFGTLAEISKIDINGRNNYGSFSFTDDLSNYSLANFFLGHMRTFSQSYGQQFDNRNQFLGWYALDTWKVTHRFTLDYGLRYEPFFPWREIFHRIMQFNPAEYMAGTHSSIYPNGPAGLLFPGDTGVPQNGITAKFKQFEPRAGFAYDLFGDGKTSLRGGGGIFYDIRQIGVFDNSMSGTNPFSFSISTTDQNAPFSNPYAGGTDPFPAPTVPSASTAFPNPTQAITFDPSGNYKIPVTYAYNLTVEQQLTPTLISRLAYVGSHSSHLFVALEENPAVYIPGSSASTNARRNFTGFSTISEASMSANTGYNSLQATLEKRFSQGFSILANYTWSKSLDTLPAGAKVTGPSSGSSYAMPLYTANLTYNPAYKSLDIGPSDFDHRHRFVVSYVWHLPTTKQFGGAAGRFVLNGWQLNGVIQAQTGDALTLTAGKDQSMTGIGHDHAQLTRTAAPYGAGACAAGNGKCVNYFNPTAFALPDLGTFGNTTKGEFTGPKYVDWDANLFRDFSLHEDVRLQFRAEYFNLLNHVNLSDPNTSQSSSGFGSITAASDPRIAQLAFKLLF